MGKRKEENKSLRSKLKTKLTQNQNKKLSSEKKKKRENVILKKAKKLSWSDRLFHKDREVRYAANLEAKSVCSQIHNNPHDSRLSEFGPHFGETIKDRDIGVQVMALDALIAYLQAACGAHAAKYAKDVCDAIVERCLTGKPKIVKKAHIVLFLLIELGAYKVFMNSMKVAVRNYCVALGASNALFMALRVLGSEVIPLKSIAKRLHSMMVKRNDEVSASFKQLKWELYRWKEREVVKARIYKHVPEYTKKEFEAKFSMTTRKIRFKQYVESLDHENNMRIIELPKISATRICFAIEHEEVPEQKENDRWMTTIVTLTQFIAKFKYRLNLSLMGKEVLQKYDDDKCMGPSVSFHTILDYLKDNGFPVLNSHYGNFRHVPPGDPEIIRKRLIENGPLLVFFAADHLFEDYCYMEGFTGVHMLKNLSTISGYHCALLLRAEEVVTVWDEVEGWWGNVEGWWGNGFDEGNVWVIKHPMGMKFGMRGNIRVEVNFQCIYEIMWKTVVDPSVLFDDYRVCFEDPSALFKDPPASYLTLVPRFESPSAFNDLPASSRVIEPRSNTRRADASSII